MVDAFCKSPSADTFFALSEGVRVFMYDLAVRANAHGKGNTSVIKKVLKYHTGFKLPKIVDRTILAPGRENVEISDKEKGELKLAYLRKKKYALPRVRMFDDNRAFPPSSGVKLQITTDGLNPSLLAGINKENTDLLVLDFDGTVTTKKIPLNMYNNTIPFLISMNFGGYERFRALFNELSRIQKDGVRIIILTMNFKDRIKPLLKRLNHYLLNEIPLKVYNDIQNAIVRAVYVSDPPRFITKLPGPQPSGLKRDELRFIKENDYYVCEKSDGERAFYFKTSGLQCTFDRKFDLTLIENMDDGSRDIELLLDCERIGGEYHVFDAMIVNKKRVAQLPYAERLRALESVELPENLFMKKIVPVSKITSITKHIDGHTYKGHEIDGLIFTPNKQPYMHSEKERLKIYKFKFPEMHTIDFKVNRRLNKSTLEMQTKDGLKPFIVIDGLGESYNGAIVEFGKSKGVWTPIRIRSDKSVPNFVTTVEDTLALIEEKLELEEVIQILT
jgi:hypothetical protein